MAKDRKLLKPRIPFTMHIEVDLWERFTSCVDAKKMTKAGGIRESMKLWLAVHENKAA